MNTFFITMIVIGVIVNIIISHLVGVNGSKREIGYTTSFLVSFFVTPIIGLLLVLTSKEKSVEEIQLNSGGNSIKLDEVIVILVLTVFMCVFFNWLVGDIINYN
jgi:hypothetical protein